MTFILALDQGTTNSRAVIVDHEGPIVTWAQREFEQIHPRPRWVEHDPREIVRSALDVARQALARAAISPADIAAIGIANQRETTVVWDRRTGERFPCEMLATIGPSSGVIAETSGGLFGTGVPLWSRETTALGAAYLAGLAVGSWRDRSQIATQWRPGRVFEPSMSRDHRDLVKARWRKAFERAQGRSDALY
jgi:glycerol kinase